MPAQRCPPVLEKRDTKLGRTLRLTHDEQSTGVATVRLSKPLPPRPDPVVDTRAGRPVDVPSWREVTRRAALEADAKAQVPERPERRQRRESTAMMGGHIVRAPMAPRKGRDVLEFIAATEAEMIGDVIGTVALTINSQSVELVAFAERPFGAARRPRRLATHGPDHVHIHFRRNDVDPSGNRSYAICA